MTQQEAARWATELYRLSGQANGLANMTGMEMDGQKVVLIQAESLKTVSKALSHCADALLTLIPDQPVMVPSEAPKQVEP